MLSGEMTERQQYWLEHIEACERSGQTTKAYAESQGLSVSMMYSWRKELAVKGVWVNRRRRTSEGFDRVRVVDVQAPATEWRLTLANGVQIGFCGAVDRESLFSVLEVASRL